MAEPFQPPLIPLTEEEIHTRGKQLARMTLELRRLREDHADVKKEFAEEERLLDSRIRKLAESIRDGGYYEG